MFPIFFLPEPSFEISHSLVIINWFWRTFEDPHSKIEIWLEHLANLLVRTIVIHESWGFPCFIERFDRVSREPRSFHSSGRILLITSDILCNEHFCIVMIFTFQIPYFQKAMLVASFSFLWDYLMVIISYNQLWRQSLTPSGLFSRAVLDFLIPDFMKEATEWFFVEDAKGSSIRTFLDTWGFWGTIPAASQVVDVTEKQCWAALYILQFSVPIHPWSAQSLVFIICRLWAHLFFKVLELLSFIKNSWASCSRWMLLGNERREYSIILQGRAMAID